MAAARQAATMRAGDPRRLDVLMLQGPVGPFFADLAAAFAAQGLRAARVTFNWGDHLFAGAQETIAYRGALDAWPQALARLLAERAVGCVVMFGDARPAHAAAVALCEARGVPVWCVEEGYVRPGYVTLERGGNNARSPLRREPGYAVTGQGLEIEPPEPGRNELWSMATAAFAQHVLAMLHLKTGTGIVHRPRPLIREGVNWIRNVARMLLARRRDAALTRQLGGPLSHRFHLAALQVEDDMQLKAHGRGWTMRRVVCESIASFARHGAAQDRLVFKAHPLDRGHRPYPRWIAQAAAAAGVADRVHLLETGPIGPLLRHARGLVTVNSTSGLSGLYHGCPVLALGDAFYVAPGLALAGDRAALDGFWRTPQAPDPRRWDALRARMHREALIPGSLYGAGARRRTAGRIAARIAEDRQPAIRMPEMLAAR